MLITANLTTEARIEGFLITKGNANGSDAIFYDGKNFGNSAAGGMYNISSSPSVVNMVFSGNSAGFGGGMYNTSSSPSIVNTVFSGNSTTIGGGMYNIISSPRIVNTVFSGNKATNNGGGMYNYFTSSPSIVNTVFSGNSTTIGGGIHNSVSSSPSIVNTVFSGNTGTTGGGIHNSDSSAPTVYNTVFYGNGSDISNSASSSATGESNFSENYTQTGFTALDADPFHKSSTPIGRDGVWFTDDDGLQPSSATSPITDEGDATKLPLDTSDLDKDGNTTEAIPFDIIGRSRALNASVDAGAYEFDSNVVLSVKEIDTSKLDIYSTGYKTLVIHGVFNAKTTANVYNLLGKLVVSKTFDKFSSSNTLDVSTLSTGIYIVEMYNTNHQVHTKKLFIQ